MADDKKIIIDEDWKSQVEAERAEAAKAKPAAEPAEVPAAAEASSDSADPQMPPASFELLLTTLATEAFVALGVVPHPATGKTEPRRNQAKFFIDTVDVLRQKTAGNLTASEQQVLDSLLHQLRMVFIETGNAPVKS